MGRSITNKAQLSVTTEASLGVLPGSPKWTILEPNSYDKVGNEFKSVPRDPISKLRQRRKGALVDADSGIGYEADITMQSAQIFGPGMFLSAWKGPLAWLPGEGNAPTSMTATTITVPNIGAALAQNTLIRIRGATNAANNAIFVVGAGSTTTSIVITGGTAETFPANASIEVCGVQCAASDATLDASGHLNTTTLNLTNLGLNVGQYVWIGDSSSAAYYFATGVPSTGVNYGLARITALTSTKATLSRRRGTWSADTGTGKTIRILFGRWIRNVAMDSADYLEPSYQFEVVYKDLGGAGTDYYEYPAGNYVDSVEWSIPLTDKATAKFAFMGTITATPSTTRATGASSALSPTMTAEMATVGDVVALRVINTDESGLATDIKSAKLTISNNASREKVIGTLGAKYMNVGNFQVDLEVDALFTTYDVIAAIIANRTCSFDFALRSTDGGFALDLPALVPGEGKRSLPKDETVHVALKCMPFVDDTLGYSASLSLFPYLPTT